MTSDDRLVQLAARTRAMGILMIFLVGLVGMAEPAFAGECYDYHIRTCVADCSDDDGEPCGEQLPGCAGQGVIDCRESTWCPPEEDGQMSAYCEFPEEDPGGPPGG